jgi:hypothetical protein
VQIGRTSDIDDEQLDIMVSSFYNGFPFDVELKHGRKDGSSFGQAKGSPYLMKMVSYNFLPWLRIFLLKKGTMKVYK